MNHVPVFYDIKCVNEKTDRNGHVQCTEIVFLKDGSLQTVVIDSELPIRDADVIAFYEPEGIKSLMVGRLKGFMTVDGKPCYRITGSIGEVIRHVALTDKGQLIETNRILVTSYSRSLAYKPGLFIHKLSETSETLLTPAEVANSKDSILEVSFNTSNYSI